jgi:TRAP-type C4-dicarboxylate transport system permease small subunit
VTLFEKIATGAANTLAVAGLSLLLAFAFFTLCDGLLRALANYPLDFVREIGDLVAAICGACCLPIALLRRSNITLRAFSRVLTPKQLYVVDVAADAVMQVIMIGMAWEFYEFSMKTAHAGDVTWLLNVPKAPFWFVVDAVLWVAAFVQAFAFAQTLHGVRPTHSEETAL